jgi:hypothetical protein
MPRLRIYFKAIAYLLAAVCFSSATAGSYEDFFEAIARDDPATVITLLRRGFDVNSRDPLGQTGLFLALRSGSLKAAEAVWQAPSLELNALNEADESPLMIAALKGHVDWCRRLLERGAAVDKTGWSPLHYAATGPEPAVVKLLLERGAAVDAESPNRSTPLMMASRYGDEASVDLLLARGADPRRANDQKLKAADFARLGGRSALAARLDALAR